MYRLQINHTDIQVEKDRKLMDILRTDCHLKSVKDGCSEGACGTCTILVDGKPVKACVQKASQMEGKEILTVEGLPEWEQDIYVYAFGEAGAVQCGFCIPGMVLCAKSLLMEKPFPTRAEIAFALRNNICRCTGYQKIIDAVEIAAQFISGKEALPPITPIQGIGQGAARVDVASKVLGTGVYVDDMEVEGLLIGSALRSSYPRARVLSIDTREASKLEGIHAILTAKDIPGHKKVGHLKKDWDALIEEGDITRYLGDAICLVAGDTLEIVEKAKEFIQVEYEPLEGLFSPEEALKENAPALHEGGNILAKEHLKRGDANQAIAQSAYVVTKHYSTPFTEHAFLEPECAIGMIDKETGNVILYTSDQGVYDTNRECSELLGLPPKKVKVINQLVGGGFGGKEDMSVQHHAALLTWYTKKPVKVKLSRKESILVHPKRHACEMEFTTSCDKLGNLTGMKARIIADTGAYASLGGPVLQRACTHAAGPYHFHNIEIEGLAVYTNNPPGGAFRGFGVTQSCFAMESNLNLLAEKVGITPWQIRYQNAIRPGEELPNGQIASEGTALVETLEAVKAFYENHPRAGIACAMKNAGVGVGIPDMGRVRLTVEQGKVHIRTGASCLGQGLGTVLKQILCEVTNLTGEDLIYHNAETATAPDSGTTSGSRQTLVTGEAAKRAGIELKNALEQIEKGDLRNPLSSLEGKEFYGEYLAKTDPMGSTKEHPVSHIAYGYATQVVLLDEVGRIENVIAAHDVGRAINPLSVEGQIEGGVVMSLGYALTEQFPLVQGKPSSKFGTLGLFRADKTPKITSVIIEKNKDSLAFGAVGIGEITSIPTAPAVQGAYYQWDHNFRTSLPLENTAYRRGK